MSAFTELTSAAYKMMIQVSCQYYLNYVSTNYNYNHFTGLWTTRV